VDFRNSVLIMTSNLGTEYVRHSGSLGFMLNSGDEEERKEREKIEKALKKNFRPEFLNRIDEIIMFSPLSREEVTEIVDLQMQEIGERLGERGLKVELTEEARGWLANIGYDPAFGARPLRRALQKHIESPLSVSLLEGKYSEGDTILVKVDEDGKNLLFEKVENSIPAENLKNVESNSVS